MHLERPADRTLDAYESHIDGRQRRRIDETAGALADVRVAHVNSTASGGGVAEMLHSLIPLLADVGVDTDWWVMDAPDDFFDVTKAIHNGLQGGEQPLTEDMLETYESVAIENAEAVDEQYDVIVLHDPQSLGMAPTLAERFPETALVWRCHIDLTGATPAYVDFVQSYLDPIDRAIFTLEAYGAPFDDVATTVIHPAIDPLSAKNRPLERLPDDADGADIDAYPFDPVRPLVVQVSRFDPWKDPLGVLEAHRGVRDAVPDAQLALVGAMPDDDPEGIEVYREVEAAAASDSDVHLLTNVSDAAINALQRHADVVLQKSLREGFALTVSEALWKETPVVGTSVGGIPLQIEDGENGFLVDPDDVSETTDRVIQLLADDGLRRRFGTRGRETVRERFLTPRLLTDYLDLLSTVSAPPSAE